MQLKLFLDVHNILDIFQSGLKMTCSTVSALLQLFNDILLANNTRDYVCLVLLYLNLTAAFHTVNHSIVGSFAAPVGHWW